MSTEGESAQRGRSSGRSVSNEQVGADQDDQAHRIPVQEFETPRAGSQRSGSGRSDIREFKKLVREFANDVRDPKKSRSRRDQSRDQNRDQSREEVREGVATDNVELPRAHQGMSAKSPLTFHVDSQNSPVQRENPVSVKEFTRAKYPVDSPPPRLFMETGLVSISNLPETR